MNLFKLMATIGLDSKEFESGVNKATEQGKKLAHSLGHGLVTGAKAAGKALLAVGTAATALAVAATKQYAEYEQLVGGVETLFKGSAGAIKNYAAEAYKTAGLSANQYMEQATSFSASLIQSLGGDTEAAAEYANKAIIDMSDNANKMGTDIGMIQNAYQGFAKQNYTMLDNLKLGYGGTKEEMKRLLEDAEKLSGKKFDLSSYADIIEAIHVIQEEMGVTGTTALEASETISGSLGMVKASFSNLLIGIADDNANFDELVNQFVESVGIVAQNIGPRFLTALEGVGQLIEQLFPVIMSALPRIINETIPALLKSASNIITTIAKGLNDNKTEIVKSIKTIMELLIQTIIDVFPDLMQTGVDIAVELIDGITEDPGAFIDSALQLMDALVTGIFEGLPRLITSIANAIAALLKEIINNFPEFLKKGGEIVWKIAKGILQSLSAVADAGVSVVKAIADGISRAWGHLKSWFNNLWDSLFNRRSVDVNVNAGTSSSRSSSSSYSSQSAGMDAYSNSHHPIHGRHASGLDYVPFDGYIASLHKGERILTREEANTYQGSGVNMGGVNITIYGAQYQDEQSLAEAVSEELQKLVNRREAVYA